MPRMTISRKDLRAAMRVARSGYLSARVADDGTTWIGGHSSARPFPSVSLASDESDEKHTRKPIPYIGQIKDILRYLPDQDLFTLYVCEATDPATVQLDGPEIEFSSDEWRSILDFVAIPAIAAHKAEDPRYYLHGIFFTGTEIHATDGYRAHVMPFDMPDLRGLYIPAEILMARVNKNTPVRLKFHCDGGKHAVRIFTSDLYLRASMDDGKMPDVYRIIPDIPDCDYHIEATPRFLAALPADGIHTLHIGTDRIVAIDDTRLDDLEESVLMIGFKSDQMHAALVPGATMHFRDRSCCVRIDRPDGSLAAVMPMR